MTMKVASALKGGLKPSTALQMADDIDVNAEQEEEAGALLTASIQPPQETKGRLVPTRHNFHIIIVS